jgi:hypothetical protein
MKIYRIAMATPSDTIRQKTYWHGTSNEDKAIKILSNGINPPDLSLSRDHMLKPVEGRIYLSEKMGYAAIYAIGGDTATTTPSSESVKESRYGYLFSVSGQELGDIQPDEDSVGEAIYNKKYPTLNNIADRYVAPSRMKKLYEGEYVYWASVGKQIMKLIPSDLKLKMIEDGAHVANQGAIKPNGCWKIDKLKSSELKRDYLNFFELAEKVT